MELAKSKVRVTVNAVYNTGIPMCTDQVHIGEARLLDTPVAGFQVVELRIVIPERGAEDLHYALGKGDVEILIQDIPSKIQEN